MDLLIRDFHWTNHLLNKGYLLYSELVFLIKVSIHPLVLLLLEIGLPKFDFNNGELALQNSDEKVPAPACRFQKRESMRSAQKYKYIPIPHNVIKTYRLYFAIFTKVPFNATPAIIAPTWHS